MPRDSARPLDVIADPRTSEDQLVRAIANLGPVEEPPEFWTTIAENASYRRHHRRHSVFQLFYRHVTPGMTLAQVAHVLGRPTWLAEDDVAIVEDLGGTIPVAVGFDRTVLVLTVLPDPAPDSERWAVYLSVAGQINPRVAARLLRGDTVNEATGRATILELGFAPPAIDSLGRRGKRPRAAGGA